MGCAGPTLGRIQFPVGGFQEIILDKSEPVPFIPSLSPNTCAIDYLPVRRYSSRHKKGCLKFLYVPRSEHEHMDIVIIGGGIGGLTLALSLNLRGIPCRV